jgi:NHLM bacteriocin system secretion protein
LLGRISHPALRQQIDAAEVYLAKLRADPARDPARLSQTIDALNKMRFEAVLGSEIRSTRAGTVVEMMNMDGQTVNQGDPIVSIEYAHTPLNAVLYLPPRSNAKLLRPGMTAEISPVTSRRERHGYLIGKIVSVAKYPSTEAGMMAMLNNAALVRELSPDGPPIAVEIELTPDRTSSSGYRWSSDEGKPLDVTSGTLVGGTFIVASRRPISLVFPMFDRSHH